MTSTAHSPRLDHPNHAIQGPSVPVEPTRGRFRPLGLDEVTITGGFLGHLQQRNHDVSLAHIEHWLEREGWLANFDAAVDGRLPQARRGREFSDSEVYKLLEALAWEFGRTRDPDIDNRFRRIAARVLQAQEPDGYLNTNFGRPGQQPRYSDLEWGHELYCAGHLIQAGVARARTSGADDAFVQAVLRLADHICLAFGPDGIQSIDGHPEIEPALVELYRVTGERRYLDQAQLFVERRGHQLLPDIEFGRSYYQDDVPVRDADILRGHAVRAVYLASGAADLAIETGDTDLLTAVNRQWINTVTRRTYITGGIGARHQDEAFAEDFMLPPDRAYSETCAAIGSLMFSWRLLLAHGDSHYADLIERTLYNAIAVSPSDDGTRFFYSNTLHQRSLGIEPDPEHAVGRAASTLRAPWFSVSCCPTNLARTFASLAGYVATTDDTGLQLHQYTPLRISSVLPDGRAVEVEVETEYPRDGHITIRVLSDSVGPWTLAARIPSWAEGAQTLVNGKAEAAPSADYARITHDFHPGDTVEVELPIRPRVTRADPRVDAVRGCVAIERGPEVLCLESIDTSERTDVDLVRLDPTVAPLGSDEGAVVQLRTICPDATDEWPYTSGPETDDRTGRSEEVVLHPYRTWGNRGPSTMRVWIPVVEERHDR